MWRFYSAFGFSLLFFLWKGSPKELPKRGEKRAVFMSGHPCMLCHIFQFLQVPAQSLNEFPALCSMPGFYVICSTNKQNKQTKLQQGKSRNISRATLTKAGPRSLIKDRVPWSKTRKHLKPKQWGEAGRKRRRWRQRSHRAREAALSLRACNEKGPWTVKVAAQ